MRFGLIGSAGYVAPRHMKAIRETGDELVVAMDPHDSVGILDSYFPECEFFTDEKRFDRHVLRETLDGRPLDYISICSPNYLHEGHCKLSMRLGANAICEKPLVLKYWNLDQLELVERQTGKKVYNILQLRLHPQIQELRRKVKAGNHYKIELNYVTPRGPWYFESWKGNDLRSGGIETNIGIHFFDMLLWVFGEVDGFIVKSRSDKTSSGTLFMKKGEATWNLSICRTDLPDNTCLFYRSIKVDGEEIRFDDIVGNLHTESYREILEGRGFGISDVRPALELVESIRGF